MKPTKLLPIIFITIFFLGINQKAYSQVNAGADQEICTDTTTLNATNPFPETGYWTVVGGGAIFENPTLYNTTVSNLVTGINTIRWTVGDEYDDVAIINNSATAIATPDNEICVTYSTITANIPQYGTGEWSLLGGGGIIQTPSQNVTQVTNLPSGANTFRWTVTNGDCVAWSDIVVTNNEIIPQTATIETCDTTAYISFEPLEGSTGTWYITGGSGNITNPTSASTVVTGLNEGLNTFTWTVYNNGCSANNIMNVNNNIIYTNAGEDQIVVTDYAEMNALEAETGQTASWSVTSGSGNLGSDVANNNLTVTDLAYGANTFRWYVSDNNTGCFAHDDVEIIRTVNAGGDITLEGDTIYLNAILPEGAIGEWTIMYGAATIEDIHNPNTKAWDLAMGLNTFRWTVTFPDKGDKGLVLWDEVNVDRILGINDLDNTQTVIFPNPSNGIINIISEKQFEKSDIYIYNITGSLIDFETLEKSPNKLIIQLKENKSGIYFIKINMQNSVIVKKIIVKF